MLIETFKQRFTKQKPMDLISHRIAIHIFMFSVHCASNQK